MIFSHSSARALTDVPRNVPDDILRQLPKNGGIVMVTFVPGFISQQVADYGKRETAERARLTAEPGSTPDAVNKASSVARGESHAAGVAASGRRSHRSHQEGRRHRSRRARRRLRRHHHASSSGLEDVSTYPLLVAELLRRGYTDDDIKKIAGRNILRVMRGAEAVRGKAAGDGPPK